MAALPKPWQGETFTPPQPIEIMAAQTHIVSRLREMIPKWLGANIEIIHFPDDYRRYRLQQQYGAILTRFESSEYGELKAIDIVNQDRAMTWHIVCICRDLGWNYGSNPSAGKPGIYGIIESVRLALSGHKIPNYTMLHPVREKFTGYEDGVWVYHAEYRHVTGAVQVLEADYFPLFIKGIAQERGGQSDIAIPPTNISFASGTINLGHTNITGIQVTDILETTIYVEGSDYSLDEVNGIVSVISGGRLTSTMTVSIGFSYAEIVEALASGGSAPTSPTN